MIYNLTIKPLSLICTFIYSVVFRYSGKEGIAKLSVMFIGVVIGLIGILKLLELKFNKKTNDKTIVLNRFINYQFILLCLSVFMGIYIPSNVIQASPLEFYTNHRTPIQLLTNTFLIYIGFFGIWMNLLYIISPYVLRAFETVFFESYLISGIINFFIFNGSNGFISNLLVYDKNPAITIFQIIIGTIIFIVIFVVFYILYSKQKNSSSIGKVFGICSIIIFAMSLTCIISIGYATSKAKVVMSEDKKEYEPILPLSTDGKNVVVIMLDKGITGYVPYIFEDKPYLYQKYDGFTYYPNTLTFAHCTDLATPSLFGGYEYTPVNINKRKDETLANKHNEALSVMPVLFLNNNFSVTVCDPPYAGYQHIPDLSIYDSYPEIKAYNTSGVYLSELEEKGNLYYDNQQQDAFFWYSIYRTINPSLERLIYNGGTYNSINSNDFLFKPFVDEIAVLNGLDQLTDIKTDGSNNFIMIKNETTHEPAHLSLDEVENYKTAGDIDYVFDKTINGETLHFYDRLTYDSYVTNMIAYIEIGNWLDYLRENGLYDNTKIIIVSDHGKNLHQFDDRVFENGMDMEQYSAVLMVKDFGAKGFKTEDKVMTIADVPVLATDEVIEYPINPFTGNTISYSMKKDETIITTTQKVSQGIGNYSIKKFDLSDGEFWQFKGEDIYDKSCWKKVDCK